MPKEAMDYDVVSVGGGPIIFSCTLALMWSSGVLSIIEKYQSCAVFNFLLIGFYRS